MHGMPGYKKKMLARIAPLFIAIIFLVLSFSYLCSGCSADKVSGIDVSKVGDDYESWFEKEFSEYVDSIDVDAGEFLDLTYEDKEYLMEVAYRAVDDYYSGSDADVSSLFLEKYNGIGRKVFVGFDLEGQKKGSYSARKDNLAESVYVATQRTIEDLRFGGITEDDADNLKIEVIILGDEKKLDDGYEKGIHGIRIENGDKGATYYNSVAIEGNFSLDELLPKLCKKAGLDEDCYDERSTDKYYFPTIHFAATQFSDEITTFYRCNEIDFTPDINEDKIAGSLALAEEWMLSNLNKKGYFNYQYDTSKGEYYNGNNTIRQLLSSRWLAEESSRNEELLQMHRENLDYIFENWYREDGDFGYIVYKNKSKIGAIGMALRTLAYSPYFEQYSEEAVKIANTLQYLQGEDGSLRAWYIEPGYSYDEEELLTYYSGEAILGLIEMYEKTGEKEYLNAAVKSQDYYVGEYVDRMDENYSPAYVPWHTISLYKLYMITGSSEYRDAIFKLNDKIIQMQNQDGKPYIDFLGRFYDPEHPEYGVPFSGSTAIDVEGLTYAYELARAEKDYERMYNYEKSILLGAHNVINLQFDGTDMYYLSHPERVKGALRFRVDDNRIRIDTTQHAIDAFSRVLGVLY